LPGVSRTPCTLNDDSVDGLAGRPGVGDRQPWRLLWRHIGALPKAVPKRPRQPVMRLPSVEAGDSTRNAVLRKLGIFADLDRSEVALLEELTRDVRISPAKRLITSDQDRPQHLHAILHGWAARLTILPNGSRQITAFLIPGDFCDLQTEILGHMDHSIVALTPCDVAWVPSDKFDQLTSKRPRLTRALWSGTLLDESIARNWIVNIGRRDSYSRLAHLLCELHARMTMVGRAHGKRMDFPVTQEELGDALGLTPVHINRTLKRLRADNLVELSRRVLTIKDHDELIRVAGFDTRYLHFGRRV
jgi:CRP-like cAMP-binding protein